MCKIQEVRGGDDAVKVQWFYIEDIPQLAFDHDRILRYAMSALREGLLNRILNLRQK